MLRFFMPLVFSPSVAFLRLIAPAMPFSCLLAAAAAMMLPIR